MCKIELLYICIFFNCPEQRGQCSIFEIFYPERCKDKRVPLWQLHSLKEQVNLTISIRHWHGVEGMAESGIDQRTIRDLLILLRLVVMLGGLIDSFQFGTPGCT